MATTIDKNSIDAFQHCGVTIINHGTIYINYPNGTRPETKHEPPPNNAPPPKRRAERTLDVQEILDTNKKTLCEWTGLEGFTILYDSDSDQFTAASFNKKVCGHKGVMVVVVTNEGNVFGCFSSLTLPMPEKKDAWLVDDMNYFVFTLVNPSNTPPTRFLLKHPGTQSVMISPNVSRKWVFANNTGFGLKQNDQSYVAENFTKWYNDPTGMGADIFTGSHFPSTFKISKLIALEWV